MDLTQLWQYLCQTNCKQLLIVLRAPDNEGQELGRSMAFAQMPAASQWIPRSKGDESDDSAGWLRTSSHLRYRGHSIRTCPVQDVDGKGWIAHAVVSKSFRYEAVAVEVWLPRVQMSEEAAQARAVELAKQWVDDTLLKNR